MWTKYHLWIRFIFTARERERFWSLCLYNICLRIFKCRRCITKITRYIIIWV